MRLDGPMKFDISVTGHTTYAVVNEAGGRTFVAPATQRGPKIYVFADGPRLLYVGQTIQGMGARMRLGFQADGTDGYYGYRWRHSLQQAQCYVWWLHDVTEEEEVHALECIESEIVYGFRTKFEQWPLFQTEIHFHASSLEHRALALHVLDRFPREV